VVKNDGDELRANQQAPTITWIGHSTFLVQIDGLNIVTDPHWGERTSPVSFAGPRRLVPPGIRFEDLPPIDAVVISHDHYDHLDASTVDRSRASTIPGSSCPSA
jgi:N-acyl-phosphatidylethanolamine-hydrolysing phospholipase D